MIKNDDIIQLKQMIIFLKAELIKYETMDDISEMNRLKQENRQLLIEKEKLGKQLEQLQNVSANPIKEEKMNWTSTHQKLDELTKMMKENTSAQKKIEQFTEKVNKQDQVIQKYENQINQLKMELTEREAHIQNLQLENNKRLKESPNLSPEIVQELEFQMSKVTQKALEYTKKLDIKLEMLDQLESLLEEVTDVKNE